MIESIILIMSVIASDGRELVSVRMPYTSIEKCEAAAHAARWVIPKDYGLEAVAMCVEPDNDAVFL